MQGRWASDPPHLVLAMPCPNDSKPKGNLHAEPSPVLEACANPRRRLLQGHLAGATVRATGVVFQDLALEQVELSSEPIDLDVGALLKGQPLQLRL